MSVRLAFWLPRSFAGTCFHVVHARNLALKCLTLIKNISSGSKIFSNFFQIFANIIKVVFSTIL